MSDDCLPALLALTQQGYICTQSRIHEMCILYVRMHTHVQVRDMLSARGMTPGWVRARDEELIPVFSWGN